MRRRSSSIPWEQQLRDAAEAKRKRLTAGHIPQSAEALLKQQITDLETKLADKADEEKRLRKKIGDDVEVELKKLVKPQLAKAFAQAATEKKLKLAKVGPFYNDESRAGDPLFSLRDASPEKFIKGNSDVTSAKEGWVSDAIEDATDRRWFVIRADKIEDGDDSAVTRRQIALLRPEFVEKRVRHVLKFGYSTEAVRERYGLPDREARAKGAKSAPKGS